MPDNSLLFELLNKIVDLNDNVANHIKEISEMNNLSIKSIQYYENMIAQLCDDTRKRFDKIDEYIDKRIKELNKQNKEDNAKIEELQNLSKFIDEGWE
jgi:DNA-binding transcriptional MerR regulator